MKLIVLRYVEMGCGNSAKINLQFVDHSSFGLYVVQVAHVDHKEQRDHVDYGDHEHVSIAIHTIYI